jgi:serine/threonine protein kinase
MGDFLEPPAPSDVTVIGRYRVLWKLSEGGMGVVYLAEQVEPVRRRVALKVIRPGLETSDLVARFQREQQALALMSHRNVAMLYDADRAADGRPFFVMEYVEGLRITEHCERHTLTVRERIELIVQACRGVEHAHCAGVVHRDLKPSNILVTRQDGASLVKVIDFGVAKRLDGVVIASGVQTLPGVALGTTAYMSPEQAELGAKPVDHRTDVYSLGVVMYELVVGVPPLDWGLSREEPLGTVLRRIRQEIPPAPSERWAHLDPARQQELARGRGSEPLEVEAELMKLDACVQKAVAKEARDRHPTAAALAEELERLSSALTAERRNAVGGQPRRRRVVTARRAGALSAVALITVAVVIWMRGSEGMDLTRWRTRDELFELHDPTKTNSMPRPSLVVLQDGQFVAAWDMPLADNTPVNLQDPHHRCFIRVYSRDAVAGRQVQVTPNSHPWVAWTPIAAPLADGSLLVACGTRLGGPLLETGVVVQRIDSSLTRVSGFFQVGMWQLATPDIAPSREGYCVVVGAKSPAPFSVVACCFDPSAKSPPREFQVNTTTPYGFVETPAVAVASDGSFTIVWHECRPEDSSEHWQGDILGQRFGPEGSRTGDEFRVNTSHPGKRFFPCLAYTTRDRLVVVWEGPGTGDDHGIFGRGFAADGRPDVFEWRVNQATQGRQSVPNVCIGPDDTVVVCWTGVGEGKDVFARLYDGDLRPLGSEFRVNLWTAGDQETQMYAGRKGVAFNGDSLLVGWTGDGPEGRGGYLTVFNRK